MSHGPRLMEKRILKELQKKYVGHGAAIDPFHHGSHHGSEGHGAHGGEHHEGHSKVHEQHHHPIAHAQVLPFGLSPNKEDRDKKNDKGHGKQESHGGHGEHHAGEKHGGHGGGHGHIEMGHKTPFIKGLVQWFASGHPSHVREHLMEEKLLRKHLRGTTVGEARRIGAEQGKRAISSLKIGGIPVSYRALSQQITEAEHLMHLFDKPGDAFALYKGRELPKTIGKRVYTEAKYMLENNQRELASWKKSFEVTGEDEGVVKKILGAAKEDAKLKPEIEAMEKDNSKELEFAMRLALEKIRSELGVYFELCRKAGKISEYAETISAMELHGEHARASEAKEMYDSAVREFNGMQLGGKKGADLLRLLAERYLAIAKSSRTTSKMN